MSITLKGFYFWWPFVSRIFKDQCNFYYVIYFSVELFLTAQFGYNFKEIGSYWNTNGKTIACLAFTITYFNTFCAATGGKFAIITPAIPQPHSQTNLVG